MMDVGEASRCADSLCMILENKNGRMKLMSLNLHPRIHTFARKPSVVHNLHFQLPLTMPNSTIQHNHHLGPDHQPSSKKNKAARLGASPAMSYPSDIGDDTPYPHHNLL